jgi:hypothetical protein
VRRVRSAIVPTRYNSHCPENSIFTHTVRLLRTSQTFKTDCQDFVGWDIYKSVTSISRPLQIGDFDISTFTIDNIAHSDIVSTGPSRTAHNYEHQ